MEALPLTGDVIVVGSGIAGLTAALEAAKHGAAVVLCYNELQDDRWMWSDGALTAGDGNTTETLLEALVVFGEGQGKTWHYELLAGRADEDLAWLAGETGLLLMQEGMFRVLPDNISYSQAQNRLIDSALGEGIRFIEGAVPQALIIDEKGNAGGMTLLDSSGTQHAAYAPSIILADGGCLNNPGLLQELDPKIDVISLRGGGEAAGVKLARAAGLDLIDEGEFSYIPAVEENEKWVEVEPPPGTLLIVDGQIIPCSQQDASSVVRLLLNNAFGKGYLVVAESTLPPAYELSWPRYAGIDAFMEAYMIDLPSLRHWFSNPYGCFCGCPVKAAAAYCLGGVAVDEWGRVLRDGRPVEGLYAIGETAGGLNGTALMPGTALTEAIIWGRRVGEIAALRVRE